MGEAASKGTTEHALGVVARVVGDGAQVAGGRSGKYAEKADDTSTR